MTVPSQKSQITQNCNGVSTLFPVDFYFLADSHLTVTLVNTDGTGDGQLLQLGSSYSVSGAGQESGGAVVTSVVFPTGKALWIQRIVPVTQETEYQRLDKFPAKTHERALDKLTMIAQQVEYWLGLLPGGISRVLRLGVTDRDGTGAYRARQNRIQDLADPVRDQDAVNKRWSLALDAGTRSFAQSLFDNLRNYVEKLVAGVVGGYGAFLQNGVGATVRPFQDKMRDTVSVLDFVGAKGDGVTDSTLAIDQAAAVGAPYIPQGIFLYTGDLDALYSKGLYGPGKVRYRGFNYAATRRVRHNYAWMGHFSAWQGAQAIGARIVRFYTADGVSGARTNFETGVTVFQMAGTYESSAMRIQRNAGDTSSASYFAAMGLTQRETRGLRGKRNTFAIHATKHAQFTGGNIIVRAAYTEEPEHSIINGDGTYTSGHVPLAELVIPVEEVIRPRSAPYYFTMDLPVTAVQCSIAVEIPFSGVAPAQDWVAIECGHLTEGDLPGDIEEPDFGAMLDLARGRYESTYPYGIPRGSAISAGSVVDVGRNVSPNWSVAFNARFAKKVVPPTFYAYAPNDGQDFRMTDGTSGTSKLGMGFDLGPDGAKFTNNHTPTAAGTVYSIHWVAISLI